jgi:Fibronectin type III domain
VTPRIVLVAAAVAALILGGVPALRHASAAPGDIVLYVAPDGDDANPGTADRPVRSLARARDLVRGLNQNMTGDIVVRLADGTYRLPAPLRLDARDSGTNGHDVVYRAAPGTRPVISGGVPVDVIRDQRGPGHGIYLDNGSYGITADGNVLVGNPHDWVGLRRDNAANDGSYSPMDIRGNHWQQGDPDRTVPGATIRGNRITAALSDAPAAVVEAAGLEPEHRDILQRRFAAPAVPDPPERVAAFAGDRFAYVSWLVPMVDGGARMASFTVTASTGRRITVSAAEFRRLGYVTVTGLTNGTRTTFTVTADNVTGARLASLPSAPVTPAARTVSKPGPPATVVAHPGNGTAAVLFTPPKADGGSPVVAYRITSGASTLTLTGRLLISGKRNVPVVLTGLTNGSSYVIEVAAVTAAGSGPVTRSKPVTPSP